VHEGEVGTEIAPLIDASEGDRALAGRVDGVLRRTCSLARALTGAEQAALKLWVDEEPSQARKYFSLSARYGAYQDYRPNPAGLGLHGLEIPPGEVIRLTQAEVEAHPAWQAFGPEAGKHPPMRGWLATAVCGEDDRRYGLLQLSDKRGDADFTEEDSASIRELAALVGATLDALRAARELSPARAGARSGSS
jgi:GAF domain-containing protein